VNAFYLVNSCDVSISVILRSSSTVPPAVSVPLVAIGCASLRALQTNGLGRNRRTVVAATADRGTRTGECCGDWQRGKRYEIGAARLSQVTETPESDYSPTVTDPDGTHISVLRVETDGRRRRFAPDGPKVVLGRKEQPATLQWANIGTGEAETRQVS
jgi:hypothetical protein